MSLSYYIKLAFTVVATTYSWGERNCGDVGHPVKCAPGAITASGVPLSATIPQVAVAAPELLRIPPEVIYMTAGGSCVAVWVVDKMNPRWIGARGFDLNPAALRALIGDEAANQEWSGRVSRCTPKPRAEMHKARRAE